MYRGRGSPSVATTVPGASSAWPSLYLFSCFSSSSDDHHSTACAFFSEPDDPPWVVDFRFDIDGPWTGLQVICNFRCEPEMTITTVIFIIFITRVIVVAVRAMLWQTPSSFLSSFFYYNRYPTPPPPQKKEKLTRKKFRTRTVKLRWRRIRSFITELSNECCTSKMSRRRVIY